MTALILFSHGSLLCGAGEAVEAHAVRLRATGKYDLVEVGYLNYSDPLFPETVDTVVAQGATHILISPYFLISGYFVSSSLPKELEKVQPRYPQVTFTIAEALNSDEALVDALFEAATNAKPASEWRDPLRRASLRCRPSADCPLYGTPACPKVPVRPEENTHA